MVADQAVIHLLREKALSLFDVAVKAADPNWAVGNSFDRGNAPPACSGKRVVIAVGKAAVPMMQAALARLGPVDNDHILAVTNYENADVPVDFPLVGASHPLPDQHGADAAIRIRDMATSLGAGDQLVLLLSGGGSALMPCPAGAISLAEKIGVTDALLKCGADIGEINTVRRALSDLKGGGLAAKAAPASVYTYILSDVPGDVLADIASGPTVPGSTDVLAARKVLAAYDLMKDLPDSVQVFLSTDYDQAEGNQGNAVHNHIVGSNSNSLDAVINAAADMPNHVVSRWLEGPVEGAAQAYIDLICEEMTGVTLFASGGETAVEVTGTGLGGRNQEMAFRVALAAQEQGLDGPWVFLSGGTDGRDGPTEAAGGLVDAGTIGRMTAAGIDPYAMLDNNDSFHALEGAGDLVVTGGTGTNVADIQICLIGDPAAK